MSITEPQQYTSCPPASSLFCSERRSPRRAWPAVLRRLRLLYFRLRYAGARFGADCDIRPGLLIGMGEAASVVFGSKCVLDRDLTIECTGTLQVGSRTIFGHHCTLAARESVVIGDDCLIAEMVSIRDHNHRFDQLPDIPIREQGFECRPVRIGNNVWLGGKVTVVRGITIGDNAVIGANSVVTRDIPANAVAAGAPARVLRIRS